jgi:hypothetical protein
MIQPSAITNGLNLKHENERNNQGKKAKGPEFATGQEKIHQKSLIVRT